VEITRIARITRWPHSPSSGSGSGELQDHLIELVEGAVEQQSLQSGDARPRIDSVQLMPIHEEVCEDANEALQSLRPLPTLDTTVRNEHNTVPKTK
jgi:hypothetical protein